MANFTLRVVLLLAMLPAGARATAADGWQAGTARVDITPPVPYRMCGYFDERTSTGVKDPLYAKAMVFAAGQEKVAIVVCDLCYLARQTVEDARTQASQATGIPADHIAVTATHSHTGPLYFGAMRDFFHQRRIDREGSDPFEKVDYGKDLAQNIAKAIASANAAVQPVELEAGYTREDRLSFNRRFYMRDGSVRFNPGSLNPDIVRAAGPIDPQVGIVSLKKPGETKPLATIIEFAMHLDTTGGTEYSADYAKFVEDRLRKSFGDGFTSMFAAGTCGDINHLDVTTRTVRQPAEIGDMLGTTVAQCLEKNQLSPVGATALAVRTATIDAPLQHYPADEVEKAKKNLPLIGTRSLSFLEQVEAYKIVSLQSYKGPTLPLEVQAIRLSPDVAIVTLPSEIFVELGLAIKAASPFKTTLVIELANSSLGYIPTKKAFAEGSYEIVNSRVEAGTGEKLVEAAIGLLKDLQ